MTEKSGKILFIFKINQTKFETEKKKKDQVFFCHTFLV